MKCSELHCDLEALDEPTYLVSSMVDGQLLETPVYLCPGHDSIWRIEHGMPSDDDS